MVSLNLQTTLPVGCFDTIPTVQVRNLVREIYDLFKVLNLVSGRADNESQV